MHAQVKEVWALLSGREGWEKLPKYALGVSSGAAMVCPYHPAGIPIVCHDRHKLIADLWRLPENKRRLLDDTI